MRHVIFCSFTPFVPRQLKGEEQHGEELRPEDMGEQPGGTLEAEQYPIDHADVDAPLPDRLVTEPVNVDDYK